MFVIAPITNNREALFPVFTQLTYCASTLNLTSLLVFQYNRNPFDEIVTNIYKTFDDKILFIVMMIQCHPVPDYTFIRELF